jgi:large-conductance mechanosensitive channel
MLFELLNSVSLNTFANQFIDYTLLTVAFFSFFKLINNLLESKQEGKVKTSIISNL